MAQLSKKSDAMTAVIHYGIKGVRAKSEFRRIGFADHNRPSRPHPCGDDAVSARHRILEQWTALGGRESGHRSHVYQTVQQGTDRPFLLQ